MRVRAVAWPFAMVAVLALTVAANGFMLYEANRGQAAVEPDYYRKAIGWDETMAQARANAALGWRASVALGANGALTVGLSGADGIPIVDATVSIEGFPIAWEDGAFEAVLAPVAGGYGGTVRLGRPGLHEVRLTVTRGADRFTAAFRGLPGSSFAAVP